MIAPSGSVMVPCTFTPPVCTACAPVEMVVLCEAAVASLGAGVCFTVAGVAACAGITTGGAEGFAALGSLGAADVELVAGACAIAGETATGHTTAAKIKQRKSIVTP